MTHSLISVSSNWERTDVALFDQTLSTADAHTHARCSTPAGDSHVSAIARGVHATAFARTCTARSPYRTHAVTDSGIGVRVTG